MSRDPGARLRQLGDGRLWRCGPPTRRAAEDAGATVVAERSASDRSADLRTALEAGLAADVLVTSGGVSVGDHDHVREAASELGVEELFWGVRLKPGKPT